MIKLLERGTFQNYRWFGVTEHIPSDEGPNTVVKIGHGCNGRLHVHRAGTRRARDAHRRPGWRMRTAGSVQRELWQRYGHAA